MTGIWLEDSNQFLVSNKNNLKYLILTVMYTADEFKIFGRIVYGNRASVITYIIN
jgi:hypothetical protein